MLLFIKKKMLNPKKSQAAMEFLMTYGWAILATAVAITVLTVFGLSNPHVVSSDSCFLSPPFLCKEYAASSEGIILGIYNGAGEELYIKKVEITNCGTLDLTNDLRDHLEGTEEVYFINCANTLKGRFIGDIKIKYKKSTAGLDMDTSGKINIYVSASQIIFDPLIVEPS